MDQRSRGPADGSRIIAVLGPTNTGKTYLAMERMLGHESGIIGFPLRLLARENYERAVAIKGRRYVALITGEEKIVPPEARYFLCTVEAMPVSRHVAFLGIDEIQMCADPDRGHIFTDRLLNARGSRETMVMGAETIRPLLRRLIPQAEFVTRPRFSALSYAGHGKITRLPAKSAVVTFSVADVYAIAELIRRQRGGAAVVLGALSPRTRNAQVEMYQAGEVAYLVATDAIGMGLNMNIEHVALAALRKFDGRVPRALGPAELAQIAGRAGRHMKDGTFGTTAEIGGLDEETAEAIENNVFPPLRTIFWRNSALSFVSVPALKASLTRPSGRPDLIRAREADDEQALAALWRDPDISARARGREAVERLWDVCRIPDFGKVMSDGHARLLGRIYRFLCGPDGHDGRLPTDWVARQVERVNRTEGDIDTLMQRIANIRTWTYIAYQGWLADSAHWQERTRAIEDNLSDVLHQRLIQRFVDRTTSVLVSRMRERRALTACVNGSDEVHVEGHYVGTMDGFRFVADSNVGGGSAGDAARVVTAAAVQALRAEMALRVKALEGENDAAFTLAGDGSIRWRGGVVARLVPGADPLRPRIEPQAVELVEAALRERVARRLGAWLDGHLRRTLKPLFPLPEPLASPAARGLLFQLAEELGCLPRTATATQLSALSQRDHAIMRSVGLTFGRESVFFRLLLKPGPAALRALLWAIHNGVAPPRSVNFARASLPLDPDVAEGCYAAAGFIRRGSRAVRADILERLAASVRQLTRNGPAPLPARLQTLLGCDQDELIGILRALGFRVENAADGPLVAKGKRPRPPRVRQEEKTPRPSERSSPFAVLRQHVSQRR